MHFAGDAQTRGAGATGIDQTSLSAVPDRNRVGGLHTVPRLQAGLEAVERLRDGRCREALTGAGGTGKNQAGREGAARDGARQQLDDTPMADHVSKRHVSRRIVSR
jgi:hypothetical protein